MLCTTAGADLFTDVHVHHVQGVLQRLPANSGCVRGVRHEELPSG
jgi:hypothetical protein